MGASERTIKALFPHISKDKRFPPISFLTIFVLAARPARGSLGRRLPGRGQQQAQRRRQHSHVRVPGPLHLNLVTRVVIYLLFTSLFPLHMVDSNPTAATVVKIYKANCGRSKGNAILLLLSHSYFMARKTAV